MRKFYSASVPAANIRMLGSIGMLLLVGSLQAGPVSLETNEVLELRALITRDQGAAEQFKPIRKEADQALQEKPDPIVQVVSEGHLKKDPLKEHSGAAMKDQSKTLSLAWAWAVTGDTSYATQGIKFLVAWAKVNQADGDALNETQFEPTITAYDLLRCGCSEGDRLIIDDWLRRKADALVKNPKVSAVIGTVTG